MEEREGAYRYMEEMGDKYGSDWRSVYGYFFPELYEDVLKSAKHLNEAKARFVECLKTCQLKTRHRGW